MPKLASSLVVSLLAVAACAAPPLSAADSAVDAAGAAKIKTVVLVHGAFADGSSWNNVIPLLLAKGLRVVAVQNPLTSLADDVAFTNRAIDAAPGPVVLVGHSWAGTVITQAGGSDKVKALVYVAAFAPSVGQTSMDTVKDYAASPGLANPVVDSSGYLTLLPDVVARDFAPDVPPAQAALMAVTQGPVRGANFEEKVTVAAWKNKPSWYVVAVNDRMINPEAERAMAKKIRASIASVPASHVVMLSKPNEVAAAIIAAAESIH